MIRCLSQLRLDGNLGHPQSSYPALELVALPPQLLKRFLLMQRTLTLMKSIPVRLLAERPCQERGKLSPI
jgi:hypothetical protein